LLQPYITVEAERLAASLNLSEMRWYSVFDGRHVFNALPLAASRQDAESIVRAAKMDMFGRDSYQIMLFEMTGTLKGEALSKTLMLKAASGAELTGIAAAAGARAAVEGRLQSGVHDFADSMNPSFMIECLRQAGEVLALEILNDAQEAYEEGEL
jgi:hypothetical protein